MMIMIIINRKKLQAPEIDFRYEPKARTVMVDFKFDALYRYVSIESLLNQGSKKS